MVKKKSSSSTEVVSGVPPSLKSASAGKGTKLSPERKKKIEKKKIEKKDMELVHESHDDDVPLQVMDLHVPPKILPEDSRTLYATKLLAPLRRKFVKADFDNFFREVGKVENVEIKYLPENDAFTQFVKIEFESHDVAKRALEIKDGDLFFGNFLKFYISLDPKKNVHIDRYTHKVIYVCKFGTNINAYELRKNLENYFSCCGEITGVNTPKDDESLLSKGYAYIQFKNVESLSKAFEKDNTQFMGRPLEVRRAKVIVNAFLKGF